MRTLTLITLLVLASTMLGAEGTWVAVGYGGRRMISTDGQTWTITAEWSQPGGDDSNNLMSAVYAQEKFVVVGGGGGGKTGGGHILVSTDGRQWREALKDKSRINPVVFGGGRFVVGTSSYPSGKLLWSTDAETWQEGAQIQARGLTHFRGGAYGNGRFVLVGNGTQKGADGVGQPIHWAVATTDGAKIVSERTDLPGHGRIVFGGDRFLMLTSHADADLISSRDGADWSPVAVGEDGDGQSEKFRWLVWAGSEFLVGNGNATYRSADGEKWVKTEIVSRASVLWSDGTEFITSSWPGKMGFSLDGKTWKSAPALTANGINQVIFAPAAK
jgi:hypothetical protein